MAMRKVLTSAVVVGCNARYWHAVVTRLSLSASRCMHRDSHDGSPHVRIPSQIMLDGRLALGLLVLWE